MKIIVVIATYNEGDNIQRLIGKILELPESLDVLVVDDNSPDGTGRIAEQMSTQTGRVFVEHRPGKLGLGTALMKGMIWAVEKEYDLACTMDADHSHAPEYLPDMIRLAENADIVIGSRYIPGGGVRNWPLSRRIISRMANFYARAIMGLRVRDCTSGYRIYSRKFLASVDFEYVTSEGFSFLEEMLYEAKMGGFTIKEFPIIFVDRIKGISKIGFDEMVKGAWSLLARRLWRSKAKKKWNRV